MSDDATLLMIEWHSGIADHLLTLSEASTDTDAAPALAAPLGAKPRSGDPPRKGRVRCRPTVKSVFAGSSFDLGVGAHPLVKIGCSATGLAPQFVHVRQGILAARVRALVRVELSLRPPSLASILDGPGHGWRTSLVEARAP